MFVLVKYFLHSPGKEYHYSNVYNLAFRKYYLQFRLTVFSTFEIFNNTYFTESHIETLCLQNKCHLFYFVLIHKIIYLFSINVYFISVAKYALLLINKLV